MPYCIKLPTAREIVDAADRKGLTMQAVCRRADLDGSVLREWHRGNRNPSIANVQKMIDVIEAAPVPGKKPGP